MCRAVNERSYWLIEMNIKKTLQALAFSFRVLNLVEKVVLYYAGLYKTTYETSNDNFQRRQP